MGGVTPTASLTPLVQVGTARSEGAAITLVERKVKFRGCELHVSGKDDEIKGGELHFGGEESEVHRV